MKTYGLSGSAADTDLDPIHYTVYSTGIYR